MTVGSGFFVDHAGALLTGHHVVASCAALSVEPAAGGAPVAASLVAAGNLEEARHVARHLLQLEPGFKVASFDARTPLSGDGRRRFAERLLEAGLPG